MPSSARVALITGCGKPIGIGNSTARALAAAGVTVVVSDVVPTGVANEHNVEGDLDSSWGGVDSLVEELVKSGRTASSTLGDVSVEADAGRMVEEVLGRYGRLDILVNNAGAPQGADRNEIEDVPVEAWDRTMGVNARGAFLMSRAAVPAMRQAALGPHRQRFLEGRLQARPASRDLRRLQGRDRRFHQIAGLRPGAVRDHRQRRLPRSDPHLAGDQHQPARIRRRSRSRLRRARQGDPGRPLWQPRRGRRDDRLPRLGRGGFRHRSGDRHRWRMVK